ncbi:MAG: hypothetical protein V3S81_05560, partial [Anaerolineales bacterium]
RTNRADKVGAVTDPVAQQKEVQRMAGELAASREAQRQHVEGAEGDDTVDENQFKVPTKQLSRRGFKRAALDDVVKEGKLEFAEHQENAVLGTFKGVQFTIDNTEEPATLISKNGDIQLPIPEEHVAGALFLSELSDDEAELDSFVEWLDGNIESLREATSEEDAELDDVIDKVTAEAAEAAEGDEPVAENFGNEDDDEGGDDEGDDDEDDDSKDSKSKKPWESVEVTDDDVNAVLEGDDEGEDDKKCKDCDCDPCECD